MPTYLVTYDLRKPGRNYQSLYDVLEKTWQCGRVAESVWIGNMKGPAPAVRDAFLTEVDGNDRLFVLEIKLGTDWAATRAIQAGINILKAISP
jgi:hypothetical protein